MFKAKLARFYGWTNVEIESLPISTANEYLTAISVISSEEIREFAIASSFHSMSKKGRSQYLKELNKSAKLVKVEKEDNILSIEDAAKELALKMRG